MSIENRFESLSSIEQEQKLRDVMEQIKKLQSAQIVSGELDIKDISFFRLPSGEVAYDVTINNPDNTTGHMYYQESNNTISYIDVDSMIDDINKISQKLNLYKNSGFNLENAQNTLTSKEQYLESLTNAKKISLNDLETSRKQCLDIAQQLGLNSEEIEYFFMVQGNANLPLSPEELQKVEQQIQVAGLNKDEALQHIQINNGQAALNSKAFDMSGIQSSTINGNDKVTTHYSFNQIIGSNYDSYKIILTKSGSPVIVGISSDGAAEVIPESRIEINRNNNKSMSLIRDDGTIKNVGVLMSFKIKDPASSVGRDQAIGLYSFNGTVNGFYARNANGDRMIGEELPSTVRTSERVHSERILDPNGNKHTGDEAKSAYNRTSDGCPDFVQNIGNGKTDNNMTKQKDPGQLADELSKEFRINRNKLLEQFNEAQSKNHSANISDEKLMRQIAEEMDQESRHEPSEPSLASTVYYPNS